MSSGSEVNNQVEPRANDRSSAVSLQAVDPLAPLALLARLHHIACDTDTLRHDLGLSPHAELSDAELLLAAKKLGLKSKLG